MAFPRWGGVLPPSPPRAPNAPPHAPPHCGGEPSKFSFWKILEVLPPKLQNSPPFGLFWSKVPPTVGGSTPKSAICSPPLWGGAAHFFKKASKTRDVTAPPQAPKSPPHFTQSPPHLCRSFGGEMLPPKGSRVGGRLPPIFAAPPHCGGD